MKRLIKLMSVALCLTIVLSASLVGVFALSLNGISIGGKDGDKATADEAELFKDETVYVMANADGTVDKIIVSDWIKNNKHAEVIEDVSTLSDVENVKTDASFTMNSNDMRVWAADGKDLYIQGESTEQLPVDLTLTYTLDGEVVTPEEIAGKSGDITIRFDYTNNEYETVEIDSKKERIYVPFFMLSGLFLDSEKFSDVEVTNGKVVSDGDRIILAGIAFPGLQHDLGLSRDDVDIPDYFEISAHTEDFELGTTVTIATNGLLNKLDLDDIDSLDELNDSLDKLDSAMSALIDGSSQLYSGLNTLLESSGTLTSGVDTIYAGAVQVSDGAKQVDNGAKALSDGASALSAGSVTLDSGALDLYNGLSTLDLNSSALTNGGDTTFDALLKTARSSLIDAGLDVPELTQKNYAEVLDKLIGDLSEENVKALAEATAKEKVTAAVEANRETITAAVTEAVRQNVEAEVTAGVKAQVTEAVLANLGYSAEDYEAAVAAGLVDEATQAQIAGAIDAQMNSESVQGTISALTEQNLQGEAAQAAIASNTEAKIASLIDENMQSDEVQQGIADALSNAKAGRQSIKDLKTQLDSYNTFNSGLKAYTGGVGSATSGASQLHSGSTTLKNGASSLSDGASALKDGTKALSDGASALADGILTLKNGVPALTEGVTALRDGSMQLSDGLKQFNSEGISKITSLKDGDLGQLATRLKATVDVSKDYKSFSGLTDQMDGEVKFIYKTEEIN
ncbi:MAG: hypothetical protein IJV48_03540 [Ruminococcus sp.]|nr:hypothetical protein [Ruminococcus sp.]